MIASTEVEKRPAARRDGSAVVVNKGDYDPLPERSVIDCGSAMLKPKSDLLASAKAHNIVVIEPLPSGILAKLRKALLESTTAEPRMKSLVTEKPGGAQPE